jgi:hypothetical protein
MDEKYREKNWTLKGRALKDTHLHVFMYITKLSRSYVEQFASTLLPTSRFPRTFYQPVYQPNPTTAYSTTREVVERTKGNLLAAFLL